MSASALRDVRLAQLRVLADQAADPVPVEPALRVEHRDAEVGCADETPRSAFLAP